MLWHQLSATFLPQVTVSPLQKDRGSPSMVGMEKFLTAACDSVTRIRLKSAGRRMRKFGFFAIDDILFLS